MGFMDGSVKVMHNVTKYFRDYTTDLLPHTKYVVRVKWGKGIFASASYDNSVCLFK